MRQFKFPEPRARDVLDLCELYSHMSNEYNSNHATNNWYTVDDNITVYKQRRKFTVISIDLDIMLVFHVSNVNDKMHANIYAGSHWGNTQLMFDTRESKIDLNDLHDDKFEFNEDVYDYFMKTIAKVKGVSV